jgi:segregation and condensation protein A
MYRVQLKNFEGPLDLLLFFIKRDELDIYDIPISHITTEFLEYIHLMEELDLDVASEFILMASILMSIKARMMLPRDEEEDKELDEADPRYELVQKAA